MEIQIILLAFFMKEMGIPLFLMIFLGFINLIAIIIPAKSEKASSLKYGIIGTCTALIFLIMLISWIFGLTHHSEGSWSELP
jgi:hypothetical protein